MKKLLIIAVLLGGLLSLSHNTVAEIKKNPAGSWKCSVPEAPYEYQEFTLIITKDNNQYSGKASAGGYYIPLNTVTFSRRKLQVTLNVQGLDVTIVTKVKAKKMEGKVSTSEGEMKITAERIVEKK